jgi:putative toxin-antitoxin system antitoxin component (TIGR02293 family)
MAEFQSLRDLLDIPDDDLGRLLAISPATLARRKKAGHLEMIESERVVRLARLFGLAMEFFEDEEAAREWLKAPNRGTAGEAPLAYADTEVGARRGENLLGQLCYGGGF